MAEQMSPEQALRALMESADVYEAEAKARHAWDEGGATETVIRGIQQYRTALAVLPVDRVGVEPLDVAPDKITDELGHELLDWLVPGAVDSRGHNRQPDGNPHGDCYKCRRVRDWLAVRLIESPTEGETP